MRYMFTMMNNARLSVGLEGLALAERSHQQAVAFAKERLQGRAVGAEPGDPVTDHRARRRAQDAPHPEGAHRGHAGPHVPQRRGRSTWPSTTPTRPCVRSTPRSPTSTRRSPRPGGPTWASSAPRSASRSTAGWATSRRPGAAQHFRDARIPLIYEGTNGIQAMDLVGRKLPMRGGAVVGEHLDRMAATADVLTGSADEDLAAIGVRLAEGVDACREATGWLLEHGLAEPNDALAGSTPYLRLLATVTGGWVLGREALAARPRGRRRARVLPGRQGGDGPLLRREPAALRPRPGPRRVQRRRPALRRPALRLSRPAPCSSSSRRSPAPGPRPSRSAPCRCGPTG